MTDPHNIKYINTQFEQNEFPIRCHWDEEKGRTMRTTKSIKPGDVICSSKPLHIVQEAAGNALFEKIRTLALDNRLIYEPIWYWCALNSLAVDSGVTTASLGLNTISPDEQRQMLTLYSPGVEAASTAVAEICGEVIADHDKVEKLLQIWKYNCFEFSEAPLGFSLYFLPSFLSHACSPNAIWTIEGSDRFVLRARKEIVAQTEITISYLPEDYLARPRDERRKVLKSTKSFTCNCARCETEEISDATMSPKRRLRRKLEDLEGADGEGEITVDLVNEVEDLPDDHWLKVAFAGEISRKLVAQKKYKLALPWKLFRISALQQALGEERVNAAYAWALEELADVQYVLGMLEEATENFQRSLEILTTMFGQESEYSLTVSDKLNNAEIASI
jgi:hypothetical protein